MMQKIWFIYDLIRVQILEFIFIMIRLELIDLLIRILSICCWLDMTSLLFFLFFFFVIIEIDEAIFIKIDYNV